MAWTKSPPELIAAFDAALPDDPRVERKKMFGFPCAFAGGHMFTGLFEDAMFVRLAEAERAKLGFATFEPMKGSGLPLPPKPKPKPKPSAKGR